MKIDFVKTKINIFLWAFIVILAFMQVFLSVKVVSLGEKFSLFNNKKDEIENENNKIMALLSDRNSLIKNGLVAEEMGFSQPKTIVFITRNENLATLQWNNLR